MAPRRAARWQDDREGVALRRLFDEGKADPTRTVGTDHMNEVYNNNREAFATVENMRNFHSAFRRTAAEYLTNNAMNGARRQANENTNQGAPEANAANSNDGKLLCCFLK